MTIDNISPAGAWRDEMKAAPWSYGQPVDKRVQLALAEIRARGLWIEAGVLEQRIVALENEIARTTK